METRKEERTQADTAELIQPYAKEFNTLLPKTEYVQVSDKPGGEIKRIPVSEFLKKVGMTGWCESNLQKKADSKEIQKISAELTMITKNKLLKAFAEINKHKDDMVITYTNDQVRFSVTAAKNIPANTYLASYSGLIDLSIEGQDGEYTLGLLQQYNTRNEQIHTAVVNAENYGNISRFFLHAPDKLPNPLSFTLHDYRFIGIKPEEVVTANIYSNSYVYKQHPIILMRTSENILKGQPLVWNYGCRFWQQHTTPPLLMAKDGSFINPCHYAIDRLEVTLYRGESRLGLQNPQISFTGSLDEIKSILIGTGGKLLVQAQESEVAEQYGISEELFFTRYYAQPQSPHLIFLQPEIVIPLTASNQNNSETQATEVETEKSPVPNLSSSLMLLSQTKKNHVIDQLNRISESLDLPQWRYNIEKDTAILTASTIDKDKMAALKDYLYAKAMTVTYGLKSGTSDPVILVIKPSVTQLKCIAAFNETPNMILGMKNS